MSKLVSRHYQDAKGEAYYAKVQRVHNDRGHDINCRFFLPYFQQCDDVLDFGCGAGRLMICVAGSVRSIEGLEVNPAAADRARELGYTVYSDLPSIPETKLFDVVISNHVLEHVRDVCSTLEVLRSHIRPGGRLVVKLPLDDFRSKHQSKWARDDVDHHLQTWTPRLFANCLYEAGFEVEKCAVLTTAWHPRLFPLIRLGAARLICWATALVLRRRQLLAVARNPM